MDREPENQRMIWVKILYITLFATFMIGCGDSLDGSAIEVDRLCSISNSAFVNNDFSELLSELEKQLKVERSRMRVTRDGVFIPMKSGFVEEQGYFVSKSKMDENTKGTDPSFDLLKGCVYRYKIKG